MVGTDQAAKRLLHVESYLSVRSDVAPLVYNIDHDAGNPVGCLGLLSSHALASAMSAWFSHHDLEVMRQWCYVAAKLDQEQYRRTEGQTDSPGAKLLQLLKPLLSNNSTVINWFAHFDGCYDLKRVENPKTTDFWAYQGVVALRGDWDRLVERCERVISDPPKATSQQKYLIDHQFYLALARGDIGGMQEVLSALVTPKVLRARSNGESGFTDDLISTPAVIYAKLAWFHGQEVHVDSPYIPAEWLPMQPLHQYDNHYGFLN